MKVRCINSDGYILKVGKIYEVKSISEDGYFYRVKLESGNIEGMYKTRFEIVKENEMDRELTFKEVIAEIKEGEVWENTKKERLLEAITKNSGLICFVNEGRNIKNLIINENDTFKLHEKEYTTLEALNIISNDKIKIGVSSDGDEFRYKDNHELEMKTPNNNEWKEPLLWGDEINGKWKIRQAEE